MVAGNRPTGLDRVLSAISGSDSDRQPFTMLHSLYGSRLIDVKTEEYYRNPEVWFNGQKAVIEVTDPDIVVGPFAFALEADAFGSDIVFLPGNPPNVRKPVISKLPEIWKIIPPDYDKSSSLRYFLQANRLLVNEYKNTRAVAPVLQSPCDLPSLLMGFEMWIDTLLFHPAETEEMIRKTTEHFVALGNEYFNDGAAFLVVTVNFTNPMIISGPIFNRLIPWLRDAFGRLSGPVVIHSGGCRLMPFLNEYAQLPNVIAFLLDPRESFKNAREIIGDKFVLMGNLDGPDLVNLNAGQIQKRTLSILNDRKDDKHFIFATSNADIPWDTPLENIASVADTIRNFKKY